METKARENYRMPWFADRLVRGYEDPTEPNLHPEHYTRYIELSAYEELQKRIEELESETERLQSHCKDSDYLLEAIKLLYTYQNMGGIERRMRLRDFLNKVVTT